MYRTIVLTLAALCMLTANSPAAIPSSIMVQGRLNDTFGVPLPAGTKTFQFRIFNDTTAGAQIWPAGGVPEQQLIATDAQGLWVARLGALSPLVENDFDSPARWLQINVDGTTLPRIRLVSEPYAFRVATVDGASGGIITSKVSIGPGHTNSGNDAFVAGNSNTVSGWFSSVVGGSSNTASDFYATVGGGNQNRAGNFGTSIAGGLQNHATGYAASIGGGMSDTATGYTAHIGGGLQNAASAYASIVAGGQQNRASGDYSTVGGGRFNLAAGPYAVVAGGGSTSASSRNFARGSFSAIGGGEYNIADSSYSTVAGGTANWSYGSGGTISGGHFNSIASTSRDATVGGGESNSAAGSYATIPGGRQNEADGNYAFAAGRRAHAQHAGTFVWADTTNADFLSTGANQFLIRSDGGVGIGTNDPEAPLHVFETSAGTMTASTSSSAVFERSTTNYISILAPDHSTRGLVFGDPTADISGGILYASVVEDGLDFRTNGSIVRMVIDSLGNVGIGDNSPEEKLDVVGNIAVSGTICATSTITANSVGCPSDLRFKREIETLPNALGGVEKLRGVSYKWKTNEFPDREFPEGQQVGLIAQEVREVIPQAVIEQSDGYLAVDYARLVPLLIESIKEQQRQINDLKASLEAMRP